MKRAFITAPALGQAGTRRCLPTDSSTHWSAKGALNNNDTIYVGHELRGDQRQYPRGIRLAAQTTPSSGQIAITQRSAPALPPRA